MFWQIAQMLRGSHNHKFIIIQFTAENLNGTIGKHIIYIFEGFFSSHVRVYDPQMRVIYVWVMISEWWKTCCVCLLNLAWPPQCGHHATIWTVCLPCSTQYNRSLAYLHSVPLVYVPPSPQPDDHCQNMDLCVYWSNTPQSALPGTDDTRW